SQSARATTTAAVASTREPTSRVHRRRTGSPCTSQGTRARSCWARTPGRTPRRRPRCRRRSGSASAYVWLFDADVLRSRRSLRTLELFDEALHVAEMLVRLHVRAHADPGRIDLHVLQGRPGEERVVGALRDAVLEHPMHEDHVRSRDLHASPDLVLVERAVVADRLQAKLVDAPARPAVAAVIGSNLALPHPEALERRVQDLPQ